VYVVVMFLFYFYCIYVLLWHINFPPGINKVNQKNQNQNQMSEPEQLLFQTIFHRENSYVGHTSKKNNLW